MRKVVLVAYYENEKSIAPNANGIYYDKFGITEIVEQVLSDTDYTSKLTISPTNNTLLAKYNTSTIEGYPIMSDTERDYLAVFKLPILAFYDPEENRFYGILAQSDFKYNAVKSCLDVIVNTKSFDVEKGYEAKLGDTTYFFRDARNAHLSTNNSGQLEPKHSLLDAVYLGANLGIFDRPYLRDAYTDFIDGLKKWWWLIPVGIAGVVVYKNRQHKRRNTRYVKYIKGVGRPRKKSTPSVKSLKKIKK